MPSLQIRNLPDDLYQTLAFRAERAHRSLAQEALVALRGVVEGAGAGRRKRILENIRLEIAATGAKTPSSPPERLLRDDRERESAAPPPRRRSAPPGGGSPRGEGG